MCAKCCRTIDYTWAVVNPTEEMNWRTLNGRTRRESANQSRPFVGFADGDGEDRPGIAGGNNRQTLTDEDGEGRHLFKRWCEAAGLEVGVDEMGTMFARREGTDPSRRRSMSAAISTRSRPAANMTACSACSAGWKWSARSTISASRPSIRSSSPTGPTRKACSPGSGLPESPGWRVGGSSARKGTPRSPPPASRERVPGRSLGEAFPVPDWERYQPVRLGQGGMGRCSSRYDPRLRRNVALKFVRGDDAELARRFLSEARAQARVDHERVCQVYEVGEVQGRAYIAMQYVDGPAAGRARRASSPWSRRCWCSGTPPRACTPPTAPASSTATSSPPTSWSSAPRTAASSPTSWTSAWRATGSGGRHRHRHGAGHARTTWLPSRPAAR